MGNPWRKGKRTGSRDPVRADGDGTVGGKPTNCRKFETVYTQQRRIAKIARQTRDSAILSLNQYLDLPWLEEAISRTRKNGAVGVDGQTAADYEQEGRSNLQSLLDRAPARTRAGPPSTHLERTAAAGNSTVGYTDNTRTSHPLGNLRAAVGALLSPSPAMVHNL